MATIKISNLRPTGAELFSDSESYMNELGDSELVSVNGGLTSPLCIVTAIRVGYAAARSSQQCAIGIAGAIGGAGRLVERLRKK
ncbi:hypothetical protein DSM106972_007060 [Dulcicalothrix desertica PCC 7102]|uniref:Uncharacterized protein n=1 Tax=Dulcicalothrix desertica PCC 7102 TaxID=232991 RepID=A0A3S1CTP6_9CYAN|nr:hypothetical protein [Dulcicalothrix desertica]RUT10211.1 hypothetical protein DSM106972_007060 [Dulcicalothrix desertica PCC 7102]TWH40811.1 hypothetical protein CAL7102_10169 [Dulcicalothrix desertica PCC 7102]